MLIVKALQQIPEQVQLVIVGKETAYAARVRAFIKEHQLEKRVQFWRTCLFGELPAIYQQAGVFVYPSEFEGFGIPILEALCSGVPVITATGSCLEEAGGPNSIYIAPKDDAALAAALRAIMQDPDKREHMIQMGKQFAATFTGRKSRP